jgi:hypothetical protein
MKTRQSARPSSRSLKGLLISIMVALLLVVGLLFVSVLLPPLDTPVHALMAPSPAASYAPSSVGISGTVASFAALFPNMVTVNLPLIAR